MLLKKDILLKEKYKDIKDIKVKKIRGKIHQYPVCILSFSSTLKWTY